MRIIVEDGQGGGVVSLFSLNFRGRVGILRCGLVAGGGCFLNFVVMEVFFIFYIARGLALRFAGFFFRHQEISRFYCAFLEALLCSRAKLATIYNTNTHILLDGF